MNSLRAKLFLSVGSILLVIAILSYWIPKIFIEKDIDKASSYLTQRYEKDIQKMEHLASSWISFRFVQTAAQLDGVAELVKIDKKSLWEIAASIIMQDPEIALVQVSDASETAVISPETTPLYTPLWAKDPQGNLFVRLPHEPHTFQTTPLKKEGYYLLREAERTPEGLVFHSFQEDSLPEQQEEDPTKLYQALIIKQNAFLERAELIQTLVPWHQEAAGILHINPTFQKGSALLTEEAFSQKPLLSSSHPPHVPFVIHREEGSYVDLVEFTGHTHPTIAIGFSLTAILAEIAKALDQPVVLFDRGKPIQLISAKGESLPLSSLIFQGTKILWNQQEYSPFTVSIGPLDFSILVSTNEKTTMKRFLNQVRDSLIATISYNLLLLALLLFVVALLLLARISKKITKPIAQLAKASEQIGKGHYEGVHLPDTENRRDEVAVLTHSFHGMVGALQDREKIRGVLNKVVSKEIASKILESSIELGGEERTLTMLFSDIRGFTHLSEILPPQKLIGLLNTYMTRMCRIVDATHGVVDKFVGDEIMALYGAPLDMNNHAHAAIEAALLMLKELKLWNQERGEHEPVIEIGIGIHTGAAFAGNMGAEDRLNYTVVGANVNLAARLCSAAHPMQILISEKTYLCLKEPHTFKIQKLDPIKLKGIDAPVLIYQVDQL